MAQAIEPEQVTAIEVSQVADRFMFCASASHENDASAAYLPTPSTSVLQKYTFLLHISRNPLHAFPTELEMPWTIGNL